MLFDKLMHGGSRKSFTIDFDKAANNNTSEREYWEDAEKLFSILYENIPQKTFEFLYKKMKNYEIEEKQDVYNDAMKEKKDVWIPANGGTETITTYRNGLRLLYCYNPKLEKHAYVNVDTDMIIPDEEIYNFIK